MTKIDTDHVSFAKPPVTFSGDFKVHSLNVPPTEIITTFYEETSFQRSDHCLLVQVPKALGSRNLSYPWILDTHVNHRLFMSPRCARAQTFRRRRRRPPTFLMRARARSLSAVPLTLPLPGLGRRAPKVIICVAFRVGRRRWLWR